jgi:pimeloyl-ACP methyl ester carboxylesterase
MKKLFILILLSVNYFIGMAQIPYGSNAKVGKYFQNRGFKMYYEVYGQGEPLLIIHGNGGSIANFRYQIPYFSKNYQVILADSRAQGKSIDNSDSLSYEMMADDLSALLDHLHKDSCYVIGWSDGGVDGLLLAIRHPEKVKKMAITGTNLTPDPIVSMDSWAVEFIQQYSDSLKKLPKTEINKNNLKLADLMLFQPHISHEQLHQITCPTLVIGGDQDVIVPRHTVEIAENIKKSNLWILPNSGHSTPINYKDIFNKTIHTFFKTFYSKKEKAQKFD